MDLERFPGEPSFLDERRRTAAEQALSMPMPDRAQHRFRYTDPAALVPGGAVTRGVLEGAVRATVDIDLPPAAAAAGVVAMPLAQALAVMTSEVAEHLGRMAVVEDPFVALNLVDVFIVRGSWSESAAVQREVERIKRGA